MDDAVGSEYGSAGHRAAAVIETMLAAADVKKVYGEPIRHGDALLIPAAEVLAFAGFGIGAGGGAAPLPGGTRRGGGGGGGGGGRTLARTVAVVVATPEGVRIKPVFDYTKILLAGLTAAGFVVAAWRGTSRRPRF